MVKQYTAKQVVERLQKERDAGRYIYTVGAGTGISAKFVEAGGADLISTYPIAKFRMAGLSSMAAYLPICDSNATTLELGEREILPILKEIPVCAGLLGVDPTRDMDRFLNKIKDAGFSGILNCPTIDLIDGSLRTSFEETGLPFTKEIEMMAMAVKKDLYTHAFCATLEHAKQMADVGVNMIVAHMGNSIGGTIGNKTAIPLDEAVERINKVCDLIKKEYPGVHVICHGGPIANHAEFEYIAHHCPQVDGYMGGSSGERFPVETSVTETTRKFKAIK